MTLFLLVGLAAAALAGVAFLDLMIRRTEVGVAVAGVAAIVSAMDLDPATAFGPFRVSLEDAVFGLLAVAGVARMLRQYPWTRTQWLVVGFTALTLYSVYRGIPLFGIGTAVNEARKYVRFLGAVLYVAAEVPTPQRRDDIARVWLYTAAGLFALTVLRWIGFLSGSGRGILGNDGDLRVIDSFATLVVLTAAMLGAGALNWRRRGSIDAVRSAPPPRWLPGLVGALLFAIVFLQHRTLWIAAFLGIGLLVIRDPQLTRRLTLAALGATALAAVLVFAVLGQGVDRVIVDELTDSATNVDTFEWRVQGWQELIEEQSPADVHDLLVGQPFGRGFPRFVDGRIVNVSPHNFYLELYLRVGVLGLAAFVALHAIPFLRLYPTDGGSPLVRNDVLAVVLAVQFLYYASSHPSPEQGVLLGLALAVTDRGGLPRRQRRPSRVAVPA